jgi:hypothetical protein
MKRLGFSLVVALGVTVACVSVPTDYTARVRVECFSPDSGAFVVIQPGDTLHCYQSKTP